MTDLAAAISTGMTATGPHILTLATAIAGVLVVIFGVRKLLSFVRRG